MTARCPTCLQPLRNPIPRGKNTLRVWRYLKGRQDGGHVKLSAGQLGAALNIDRGSAGQSLRQLERDGFIRWKRDPNVGSSIVPIGEIIILENARV